MCFDGHASPLSNMFFGYVFCFAGPAGAPSAMILGSVFVNLWALPDSPNESFGICEPTQSIIWTTFFWFHGSGNEICFLASWAASPVPSSHNLRTCTLGSVPLEIGGSQTGTQAKLKGRRCKSRWASNWPLRGPLQGHLNLGRNVMSVARAAAAGAGFSMQ